LRVEIATMLRLDSDIRKLYTTLQPISDLRNLFKKLTFDAVYQIVIPDVGA